MPNLETAEFKLSIGNKRQVTIPRDVMKMFELEEGGDLLLTLTRDHAVLVPMVSIPRNELPEPLRRKFLSRRGIKSSDVSLDDLEKEARKSAGKHNPQALVRAKQKKVAVR